MFFPFRAEPFVIVGGCSCGGGGVRCIYSLPTTYPLDSPAPRSCIFTLPHVWRRGVVAIPEQLIQLASAVLTLRYLSKDKN